MNQWSQNISFSGKQVPQYSPQQTAGAANYQRAMADYEANPRYTGKKFQQPGVSSSAGTAYMGAAAGADAYAKNMAASEATRMGDAYYNASQKLDDDARRAQFGTALARLNEQRTHGQAMDNLQTAGSYTGLMGDLFGSMASGFGGRGNSAVSILQGLL